MVKRTEMVKRAVCVGFCAALLAGGTPAKALAADVCADVIRSAVVTLNNEQPNVTHSGPLTIEAHLLSRLGYPRAYYTVIIYAPSDVVGIRINDMDVLEGNAVQLEGAVSEVESGTGDFGSITVKVTLYYSDGSTYMSYETINVSHRCGVTHSIGDNCTP